MTKIGSRKKCNDISLSDTDVTENCENTSEVLTTSDKSSRETNQNNERVQKRILTYRSP